MAENYLPLAESSEKIIYSMLSHQQKMLSMHTQSVLQQAG
jgi:hypothetical protein